MNWEMIGAIGEVGGAVAVVVTLVYLARQVRDSARQERRNRYVELNRDATKITDAIARDLELSDTFLRGMRDRTSLSQAEAARFAALMLNLFRAQEALFFYHREGGVDDWAAGSHKATLIDVIGAPGAQDWWAARRSWFAEEFQAEVDRWISEASTLFLRPYEQEEGGEPTSEE